MSVHYGAGLTNQGLVLDIDMENPNCWRGKAISNRYVELFPYDLSGNISFPINGSGTFRRIYEGTFGGYQIRPTDLVYRYDLGSNGCHYHGMSSAITTGQYASFTFDYYVSPDAGGYPESNYLANFENYGGGAISAGQGAPNNLRGVWQTVTFGGQASANGTQAMFLYPGGCGPRLASSGFILYKNPQVIFSSISNEVQPYTKNARNSFSSPGGGGQANTSSTYTTETWDMVDMAGYHVIQTVDLPVTGGSNASIGDFNGTTHRINYTLAPSIVRTSANNSISRTWEVVFKINTFSSGTNYAIFGHKVGPGCSYYCNGGIYVYSNSITCNWYDNSNYNFLSSNVTPASNQYYHVVATYTASDQRIRIYVNGTLRNTSSATNNNYGGDSAYWEAMYNSKNDYGGGGSTDRTNGRIPIIRHYVGKALDAAEVAQHYEALKPRFSLL